MNRKTLTTLQWVKAAFALPFIPGYYLRVASTIAPIPTAKVASVAKTLLIH